MEKSANLKIVQDDILRFKKNKIGQMLAYLGLVFNCLYFMLLYAFNNTYFYVINIGVSVLLNLILLLAIFLAGEGVKSYTKKYCIVLLVIAVIQIIRIFGLPLGGVTNSAFTTLVSKGGETVGRDYFGVELSQAAAMTLLVVYLVISAVALAFSAVWSYLVCIRHEKFNKALEDGSVNVEKALEELEKEEDTAAAAQSRLTEVQ